MHNFTKFPGLEFCLTWNFQGYREKPKQFHGFFFKKNVLNPPLPPPCLFFSSGIAHSKTTDLKWSYEALAQKEALTICQDQEHLHHFHVFYHYYQF